MFVRLNNNMKVNGIIFCDDTFIVDFGIQVFTNTL